MEPSDQIARCCSEFEAERAAGRVPRIEGFLQQTDAEQRITLLERLIPLDLECRTRMAEPPQAADYVTYGELALEIDNRAIDKHSVETKSLSPADGRQPERSPIVRFGSVTSNDRPVRRVDLH